MSYCEIIPFRNGIPGSGTEFRNAWGGAARIWGSLFERYLKDPNIRYHTWLTSKDSSLWDLAKDSRLSVMERVVHASTFDFALIARADFVRIAGDLRAFDKMYPVEGSRVNHLPAWADAIEHLDADQVGFYHNSVSENVWFPWDEESQASLARPISDGFDVYEWVMGEGHAR